MHTFDLNIGEISKIEGKASLEVKVNSGKVDSVKFKIDEYKRFYTQAIRGKDIIALPQLCARICGTCSNAHLLCAMKAVEDALCLTVSPQTKLLRELLNYGLIIRDHGLHLCVFVLPDYLGVDNILELDENKAEEHEILDDTFTIKSAGNELAKLIGGRSVHAPFPMIGGFTRLPDESEFPGMISTLEKARPAVIRLIERFAGVSDTLLRDIRYAALMGDRFSFLDGEIVCSDGGPSIKPKEFGNYLEKEVIPYSHASGYKFKGTLHMVGALARMNVGKNFVHPDTRKQLGTIMDLFPSKNVYHNNLAQAIEILHAIDSSLEILKKLKIMKETPVSVKRREGTGVGVVEAPRGTLYYKLEIDSGGKIVKGDIVVPTGQNQVGIEKSIYEYISANISKDKNNLVTEIEKIIRIYDPCMSCASHFLKVKWQESR